MKKKKTEKVQETLNIDEQLASLGARFDTRTQSAYAKATQKDFESAISSVKSLMTFKLQASWEYQDGYNDLVEKRNALHKAYLQAVETYNSGYKTSTGAEKANYHASNFQNVEDAAADLEAIVSKIVESETKSDLEYVKKVLEFLKKMGDAKGLRTQAPELHKAWKKEYGDITISGIQMDSKMWAMRNPNARMDLKSTVSQGFKIAAGTQIESPFKSFTTKKQLTVPKGYSFPLYNLAENISKPKEDEKVKYYIMKDEKDGTVFTRIIEEYLKENN